LYLIFVTIQVCRGAEPQKRAREYMNHERAKDSAREANALWSRLTTIVPSIYIRRACGCVERLT